MPIRLNPQHWLLYAFISKHVWRIIGFVVFQIIIRGKGSVKGKTCASFCRDKSFKSYTKSIIDVDIELGFYKKVPGYPVIILNF
jgi:hypothetical protein